MILGPLAQGVAFAVFALIAVAGALGMATTMSMFRSGIFLMASFVGVAGLFILLSADLLSLLQVMMYIGGMLVMILFMVLFSHDPGGAMMAGMMELPLIERVFSLGLVPNHDGHGQHDQSHGEHHAHSGGMSHDQTNAQAQDDEPPSPDATDHTSHHASGEHGTMPDMDHQHYNHVEREAGQQAQHDRDMSPMAQRHGDAEAGGEREHAGMDMDGMDMHDMSMTTPIRRLAAMLAMCTGGLLVALLLWRPAWPITEATPDPQSAHQIGSLLMGKYMIAFEGAGLLILIGIFGAVLLSRPGSYPDAQERGARVAINAPPAPIATEPFAPLMQSHAQDHLEPLAVREAHQDDGKKGMAP